MPQRTQLSLFLILWSELKPAPWTSTPTVIVLLSSEQFKATLLHRRSPEDHRKELGIGDVLHHGADDSPRLLEQGLSAPLRVDSMQLGLDAVVFSQPDRVYDGQNTLLVDSIVTWARTYRFHYWSSAEKDLGPAALYSDTSLLTGDAVIFSATRYTWWQKRWKDYMFLRDKEVILLVCSLTLILWPNSSISTTPGLLFNHNSTSSYVSLHSLFLVSVSLHLLLLMIFLAC